MKIYRLDYRTFQGTSAGFSFHSSARAATTARLHAETVSVNNDEPISAKESSVVQISVTPDKAGIIAALNKWAGHPDNG